MRRSSSEIGIVDRVNDLGAMAWAVAPELNCFFRFVKVAILVLLSEKQSQEIAKVR